MPQLLRLRFVSLGHPQARMEDLVLDFRGPDGGPVDSTLWLRNGGGKSSILNLFFAIVRPHKGEFLGGKAEAKQRSLNDYILVGDRGVAAAEWQLDPAADALGLEPERFLTGVFYERREGSGELRRLFFSCRVDGEHPESTLEALPLYTAGAGARSRRTLGAFREAWRSLRDRAPHLGVGDTEHQREWQEVLEAARIDPELFTYQVVMNQKEGGADELFRFAEAEDFIDFLLELALDPALGDRVGKNITAFRRELLQRREQLVPERELVTGLLARMAALRDLRARRSELRAGLGEVRDELGALAAFAAERVETLGAEMRAREEERARHEAAAGENERRAGGERARAAQLRWHGAGLRHERLKEEHRQVQEEWRAAQGLARIWAAAIPLRRALHFEDNAKEQRQMLRRQERKHAPLRAKLEDAARRFAAALRWRADEHRRQAAAAAAAERAAREEAREHRRRAGDAGREQSRAEAQAGALEARLAAAEARRRQLVGDELLGPSEAAEAGLARWAAKVQDHGGAVERLGRELARLDAALEALERAIEAASDVLGGRQAERQQLADRLERATRERHAIERDAAILAALELEAIDADRLGGEAIGTLEQAARGAQRIVVETRMAMAEDERDTLHLEEHGLLPPSPDAQRVLELLEGRLGGQAWSGWSWIQANVRAGEARAAVQKAPSLAQGVVVRPGDLARAIELLGEVGLEPDGPLLIADTGALDRTSDLPGVVVGPKEAAWFDREIARVRLTELRDRLDQHQQRLGVAEARHRELTSACEALRAFRARYPVGWFERAARDLRDAELREEDARGELALLQEDRRRQAAERKDREAERHVQARELAAAQVARQRVQAFVDDHARPSAAWRSALDEAKRAAIQAAEEARRWEQQAEAADELAAEASDRARREGEAASVLEAERSGVAYVVGDVPPAPGALDELRGSYLLRRSQYEEKVGAEALLALAEQNEEYAKTERGRLAKLLSPEITEELVREHLARLAEPDAVDQLRQDAEARTSSLFGRLGSIGSRVEPAAQALAQAEKACLTFGLLPPLEQAPGTPELAEAEASKLEGQAAIHEHNAEAEHASAGAAQKKIGELQQRRAEVAQHLDRVRALQEDYADLLAAAPAAAGPPPSSPTPPLEEALLPSLLKQLGDRLRRSRGQWQALDRDRGTASTELRAFAAGPAFERLNAPWLRHLQEHDEPALEDASAPLCDQLELRRGVLDAQIADVERHRTVLVDELHAVAEEGMKLLRQASNLSRLPDHLPGIGGAHFLRIQTQEPEDPAERRARLAELIDELLAGGRELGGVPLVQAAVRRLARPVQVRVLHPDPALDRRLVSIPEMARSSGGEQLTGAILLYCTLARVRGRARGLSRRTSSVLILDNPIGRASRVRFLELQRDVARAMGVQLIYTTGVNDHEALRALPNIVRLRNERVDRNSGRRLVEHAPEEERLVEAVRVGRREPAQAVPPEGP